MNSKQLHCAALELIGQEDTRGLKKLVEGGLDLHESNDYLLYIAVFYGSTKMQRFLIEQGLDPEVTLGRLQHAYHKELIQLREYKAVIESKKQLECALQPSGTLAGRGRTKRTGKL